MPLLDIAISQASLQHHLGPPRAFSIVRCKVPPCPFTVGDARRRKPSWGSFQFPIKVRVHRKSRFMVRAVATLEPKSFSGKGVLDNDDAENGSAKFKSLWEDSEELDAKEKIRRMRISKANRGLTPWNKGRKHSPETIQRIKERTKVAMQDPKIKMKLNNHGHSHREETKIKISQGLRTRWQKRHEKQLNQETCYYEWQNLISDASRNGYTGEEELQWNSNQILTEKIAVGDERRREPSCFQFPSKVRVHMKSRFMVKAVATLEPKSFAGKGVLDNVDAEIGSVKVKSLWDDSEVLDAKEKIRRMRISKANRGLTPWNKGRKHSPETIQRIKERTKLAMQDPKIKMKLNSHGHSHREETKINISQGLRIRWQKRREKQLNQETCYYEWQNLISDASRNGYTGEEELQWNSNQILTEKIAVGDERRQRPSCEGFQKCRLVVKVVPNLEPNCLPGSEAPTVSCKELMYNDDTDNGSVEVKSKGKDWEELDEKERLRRMRISKANKGNTPWNAGRKHRPETIQRIKEGTRLAMQDPEIKFKMKISKFGHTQSEETKLKIAAGQRKRWQKYHKTLRCLYEWQNLIAEASRNGYAGQEELQWNSYQILSEKLAADWAQSDKLRPMPRQQRKKIGKTMGAKWADPVYRERVLSAVARFYERSERDPRKPGEKPSDGVQTRKKASSEQKTNST